MRLCLRDGGDIVWRVASGRSREPAFRSYGYDAEGSGGVELVVDLGSIHKPRELALALMLRETPQPDQGLISAAPVLMNPESANPPGAPRFLLKGVHSYFLSGDFSGLDVWANAGDDAWALMSVGKSSFGRVA